MEVNSSVESPNSLLRSPSLVVDGPLLLHVDVLPGPQRVQAGHDTVAGQLHVIHCEPQQIDNYLTYSIFYV